MRELTFLGFLQNYVKNLSEQNTLSIRKLVKESGGNPRLREPLFLYALESDKLDLLAQCVSGTADSFAEWVGKYTKARMHTMLEEKDDLLPANFHKVWRSYQSVKNRQQSDDHTKSLMRARLLRIQKEKNLSNYRLYTDLGLNPGNLNAWLKHGDSRKISLAAARDILRYAQEYGQTQCIRMQSELS